MTEVDLYEAAAEAMLEGQYQEAQDIYLRIATNWPNQFVAIKNLAFTALLLDDPHGAIDAAHLALYIKEDDPEVLNLLASAYTMNQENDKAIQILTGLLMEGFDREDIRFNLGHAYYKKGDWDNAIHHLQKTEDYPPAKNLTKDMLTRANLNRIYTA